MNENWILQSIIKRLDEQDKKVNREHSSREEETAVLSECWGRIGRLPLEAQKRVLAALTSKVREPVTVRPSAKKEQEEGND